MKLLVLQIAALGYRYAQANLPGLKLAGLPVQPLRPCFPALTCTFQAGFRTGLPAAGHGMVGNGWFERDLRRALFWEQAASQVAGERIWQDFRARGKTVGLLFWQQSLGEAADLVVSPAPIHKHGGGMVQDCYSQPPELYRHLCGELGRGFNLRHYWGPLTSAKGSEWIAAALARVLRQPAPDLLLGYLPHLDYELQKTGPESAASRAQMAVVVRLVERLAATAREYGYRLLLVGDYAIETVAQPVFPNRALFRAGLLPGRRVQRMLYPDLYACQAFAVVDHQVAQVICRADAVAAARDCLAALPGVGAVLDREAQRELGVAHPRSGELLLVAAPGAWFAYPWWTDPADAPDYARHVDIHNKPGYDPCELFFGRLPVWTSQDHERIRGSHGRVAPELAAAFATDLDLPQAPATHLELAGAIRQWLARAG